MTKRNEIKIKFLGFPLDYESDFWMCPRILDEYWWMLSKAECKLLICILRKILGWKKQRKQGWDYISQSQFIKYTRLSKNSITSGMRGLVEKGFIRISDIKGYDGTLRYELVMSEGLSDGGSNFDNENQILNKGGSKIEQSGSNFEQDRSKTIHTIDTNNKELNIEKNIEQIFSFYKKMICPEEVLEDESRKMIKNKLGVFSCDELEEAIDNFSKSEWWMERNGFRGAGWFFKSNDKIRQWLKMHSSPKDKKETLRRGSHNPD